MGDHLFRLDIDPKPINDLHHMITVWLPYRKKTIKAMEEIACQLENNGKQNNTAKLVGSSVGAISGMTSAIVGFTSIVATGGLATPLVVAGMIAGPAGIGGAIVSCGADIRKCLNKKELDKKLQEVCEEEVDMYKTIIKMLLKLDRVIKDKLEGLKCQETVIIYYMGTNGIKVSLSVVNAATNALTYLAEIGSQAAGEAAVKAVSNAASKAAVNVIEESAKNGAKTAIDGSVVGKVFNGFAPDTTAAIATTAGEKVAQKITTEGGEVLASTAAAYASPAAREVARNAVQEPVEALVAHATRSEVKNLSIYLSRAVPFISAGAALWDGYEGYKAYNNLACGIPEAVEMRKQIQKLKNETNMIVVDLYNPFVPTEMKIKKPFPE